LSFTGAAAEQVGTVVAEIEEIIAEHPTAAEYTPPPIL
jgi:adenylosuccinate lyase